MRLFFFLFFAFSLFSCQKDNPCKGITCANGGTCVNGVCDCPPQWTGPGCKDQKEPIDMKITSIQVTKYPIYDAAGSPWDIGNAPDLYITIEANGAEIYNGEAARFVNTNASTISFTTNALIKPNDVVRVRLYDYDDFDADDYVGGISGFVYSTTGGFPDSYKFECAGCATAYTLNLAYRY